MLLIQSQVGLCQVSIQQARDAALRSEVTIEGIITNGSELGEIRYLQDETAGVALFPSGGTMTGFEEIRRGDRVRATGILTDFNGLLELSPVSGFEILERDVELPEPLIIAIDEMGDANQAQLVSFECITILTSDEVFAGGKSYVLQSADGSAGVMYLFRDHELVGEPVPTSSITIAGLSSDFNGAQLIPRDVDDILEKSCFSFSDELVLTDQDQNSLELGWSTNVVADEQWLEYRRHGDDMEDYRRQDISSEASSTSITNLEPATFYFARIIARLSSDTIRSQTLMLTTQSASSGEIRIYFNEPSDTDFSSGALATATTAEELDQAVIQTIDDASRTVDYAAYNTNRLAIVDALQRARDRGVRVRVIADNETSNTGLNGSGLTVLKDQSSNLMHNKFIVTDVEMHDRCQVVTGSTNFTVGQIFEDPNHLIIIQDQALAKAYTIEYEEMWGSKTSDFDPSRVRFGPEKMDNTPHQFKIGDVDMELYFSPSDQTNEKIIRELQAVQETVDLALLIFTREDIANLLAQLEDRGVEVRLIIEDTDNSDIVLNILSSGGAETSDYPDDAIFHHKYAILDGRSSSSAARVITGSHNWTTSANFRNDENTLIIHDPDIANIFYQDFQSSWLSLTTHTADLELSPQVVVYPNPSSGKFMFKEESQGFIQGQHEWILRNAEGQILTRGFNGLEDGLDLHHYNPGLYFLQVITKTEEKTLPLILQH